MMHVAQGSSNAEWSLDRGEARSLSIGPGPRLLRVASGSVWLTEIGRRDSPADDVWLREGDSVALDDGAEVLIEGWPQARFQLLVPPCRRAWRQPAVSAFLSRLRLAA